jgi:predicted membrane-bound spermidine synthase
MDQEDFDQSVVKTQLSKLDQLFPKDKIFRSILNYLKLDLDNKSLQDAFSRSQIKSKIWLIDQLAHVQAHYKQVAVLAGWFGQIKSIYDQQLTYGKMRIVELDPSACEISDHVFNANNLENHKVKSVCADINQLTLHKNGYEWSVENFRDGTTYNEKFLPDLIINTSAEHMTEEWYHQLRFKQLDSDPIVAIQSNNLFDIPEHVNCVHSVDHMMKKYPMREVLFAGELQLKGYKRVMLIGRP